MKIIYSQRYIRMYIYIFIIGTYSNGLAWFVGRGSVSILMTFLFFLEISRYILRYFSTFGIQDTTHGPCLERRLCDHFHFLSSQVLCQFFFPYSKWSFIEWSNVRSIFSISVFNCWFLCPPFHLSHLLYIHPSSFFSNELFPKTWLNSLHGQKDKLIIIL